MTEVSSEFPEPIVDATSQAVQFPKHDKFDSEIFHADMARASRTGGGPRLEDDPSAQEQLSAAFRMSNTLGSALASKSLTIGLFDADTSPKLDPEGVLTGLKAAGLAHHANLFTDVTTQAQYDARVADLTRELADRKTLQASGGLVAELAMGLLDPVNLVPIAGGVGRGVKAALKAGASVGGMAAVATELPLQATQVTRTWEEGLANVGASVVFGAGLGFGGHALTSLVGQKTANKVLNRTDEGLADLRAGGPKIEADIHQAAELQSDVLPGRVLNRELADFVGFAEKRDSGDLPADLDFAGFRATQARSSGAAAVVETRETNVFTSSDRIDARLAGIPMDKLLKNFGKIAQKLPYLGEAIAQGLRNPRLELQDAISPTARDIVSMLDENPYILRAELQGKVRTQAAFSEVFRGIEGGHATAIKEIEHLYRTNAAEFGNDRAAFGERVYFAAINNDVDTGGSRAVEKAAVAYHKRVFDPILKLYQDAGLLKEGIDLHGADSYVPWVHRADAIINDKENFLSVHETAFGAQLNAELNAAFARDTEHTIKVATEVAVVETERNVRIAEVKKKFGGDDDQFGKIAEAQLDKKRALEDVKLARTAAIDKAKADRVSGVAGGVERQAASQKYQAELRRIEGEFAVEKERATVDADSKIAATRKARDDEIAQLNKDAKSKIDKLRAPTTALDREILKLRDPEKRAERAKKLADTYYKGATSGADHLMIGDDTRDILLPSVLKARKSPLLQQQAAEMGWAETNIFELGDIYHRSAGAAAAMGTVFKKARKVKNEAGETVQEMVADINLTASLKLVAEDFDRKIAASGGGETEIKLRQAKTETIRNIEIIRDGLLGRRETFGSKGLQESADLAMQFNSWRLMGGSVLSSLGDPVNIAITNGFGKSWSYGVVPALQNFKAALGRVAPEDEAAIFRMNRLAAAVIEREKNSFMGALMDLHNPGAGSSLAQRWAKNVSRQFWNWSGLTAWTTFWKNVATNVTHARIIDAAQRGADALSNSERAWLANLRIDGDVLSKIGEQYAKQPQKFSAGIPFGAFDLWDDALAASRFADALSRESKNVIVTPTVGDRLAFQATPFGQMAGQFRSYGLGASARLISRNAALKGLDGEHTGAFYTGMFALGMMGIVVDATKFIAGDLSLDGASKRDPQRSSVDLYLEKWQKTPGEAAYNALDRTGMFMPLMEPSNIAQKVGLPNIQGAFSMLARDEKDMRKGSSRLANRHWTEAIGGPTIGLVGDVAKLGAFGTGFSKYAIGINEEFNGGPSDFARARRMLPFQNVPGIQQTLNWGHQHLGTAFDWPID